MFFLEGLGHVFSAILLDRTFRMRVFGHVVDLLVNDHPAI